MQIAQIALRALQFLWILLITALIGNAISEAYGGNPPTVNYCIFVAVWCWLTLIFGFAAAFVESLAIFPVLLAMDALSLLFTFVAGVVLAAQLGANNCSDSDYTSTNFLTLGSGNNMKRCRELQASCAFFWFLFATYAASLALTAFSGGSMMSSRRGGGMRKGGPSMSQV